SRRDPPWFSGSPRPLHLHPALNCSLTTACYPRPMYTIEEQPTIPAPAYRRATVGEGASADPRRAVAAPAKRSRWRSRWKSTIGKHCARGRPRYLEAALPEARGGQSLVELALILPILLIIMLGALNLGLAIRAQLQLAQLSQQAAQYLVHHPTYSDADAGS